MKSLKNLSFIDLSFDGKALSFGPDVPVVEPACRTLAAASYAFADEGAEGPAELYYMYRDVARPSDRQAVEESGLRYDVTVVMPGAVGREFNKTVGHYHPVKADTDLTYPEVYEVLSGQATYLLQKPGEQPGELADVAVVVASPGDKVVIPPGYGHITINAAPEPLVMANWVAAEFASVYGDIKELRGGGHYLLSTGEWVKNPLYGDIPPVQQQECCEYPQFGLLRGQGMYALIEQAPAKLRFLTHPEEFDWE